MLEIKTRGLTSVWPCEAVMVLVQYAVKPAVPTFVGDWTPALATFKPIQDGLPLIADTRLNDDRVSHDL